MMLFVLICGATAAEANRGVVFVHGTSANNDALNEYWTPEFVGVVAQGLPDPSKYFVINCDFTKFPNREAAGGCLASQILSFVNAEGITDLRVFTHSHGGNMMRWILSNPGFDARYPPVIDVTTWVIALAPSSLGTPLADAAANGTVFEQLIGLFLGYNTEAVVMQQVGNMQIINNEWLYGTAGRPPLPKTFAAVVGTDVLSSPFSSASYCGGYGNSVALEFTQNWLDSCSDGFLPCDSQVGAGDVFYADVWLTSGGTPLNHQQSRRNCFGFANVLKSALN
jgi:hypothetical protein